MSWIDLYSLTLGEAWKRAWRLLNGLWMRGYTLYGVLEEIVRPTLRQGSLMAMTRTCCYVTGTGMSAVAVHG